MKKRGNPGIGKYQFTTEREEPLGSPSVSVRFTSAIYEALQDQPNIREFIRMAVEEKLQRDRAEKPDE